MTVKDFQDKKARGEKITMLTAYDFPMAAILDGAGVDVILVGDSLANVVLGLESTRNVSMADMIHHAKAVRRGVRNALLIGDMPYSAYQENTEASVTNAKQFIDNAGCDAVKLEWFDGCLQVAKEIVAAGIPVMGHVGLTPQTADKLGGFKVQGRDADAAKAIIEQAKALQDAGCFGIVLECVPQEIGREITEQLTIPTIGIGAGPFCDGQVLVTHDLLGLFVRFHPKFVKQYADLDKVIRESVTGYIEDVRKGTFPGPEQSYAMSPIEWQRLKAGRP